jgi:hypothetical protein
MEALNRDLYTLFSNIITNTMEAYSLTDLYSGSEDETGANESDDDENGDGSDCCGDTMMNGG